MNIYIEHETKYCNSGNSNTINEQINTHKYLKIYQIFKVQVLLNSLVTSDSLLCVLHRVCEWFDGHDHGEGLCRPSILQSWDSEDKHPAGTVFRIWASRQGGGHRQLRLQIQSRAGRLKPPYLPWASKKLPVYTKNNAWWDNNPYLPPKEAPAPAHKISIG